MSVTPRTDAAEEFTKQGFPLDEGYYVGAEIARTLERELAAAQARIAELERAFIKHISVG